KTFLSNMVRSTRAPSAAHAASFRKPSAVNFRRLVLPLSLAALCAAAGAQAATTDPTGPATLVDKVRVATDRYQHIEAALREGWVRATPCVSGPNEGAMGIHLLLPDRLGDGLVKADEPEALIYEPQPNGGWRLVGVEFIALASTVQAPPSLEGHLLNYVGEPNRYGLPAFYEMHVWAWQDTPKGNFADFNTSVSCEAMPLGS